METQVVVGDNVGKAPQILDLDILLPDAKRRKTGPSTHSPDPIQNTADKELERLSPGDYTLERLQPHDKSNKPASSKSLGSALYVNGNSLINNRVTEYLLLENIMDSSVKRKTKYSGDRFQSQLPTSSSTLVIPIDSASSKSNPIDLSRADGSVEGKTKHRPQPAYRGTARDPTKVVSAAEGVNKLSLLRENGERSRHFENPETRPSILRTQNGPKSQDGNLANLFRDTNGKRRSMDMSYSSDELDSATTVGVVVNRSPGRRMTPQPRSRRDSPTKDSSSTQKALSSPKRELRLPPSMIPPTTFSNSGAKRQCQKTSSYNQEKKASWGIPLAGVRFAGIWKRSNSLGLQFDENTQSYVVLDEGKNLGTSHPSLRIQPKKLLKVLWAESGGKIRFESSKSGNNDTKLDLEVKSERDSRDLIARLQESNDFKVESRPRERMEKMFHNNMTVHSKALSLARPAAAEVPEDVQLATRNKQRRDEARDIEASEQSNSKRPRVRPRTIDRSTGGSYQDFIPQASKTQSKIASILKDILGDDPRNAKIGTMNGKADHLTSLDSILENSQAQNSHIPQSQIETRAKFKKPKDHSPIFDDFPEEERYSKKFGLGTHWAKPLVYPKVGKKKTTVEWSDLERLDEGQYLNDNLIGFYLRFLEHQAEENTPELLRKVYFFNTFFFASLTNTQRGKKPINYESVQKWTRGIDLFTYDYVVVPINESAHWYVAIICNLPELIRRPAAQEDDVVAPPHSDPESSSEAPNERPAESADPVITSATLVERPVIPELIDDMPQEQEPTASFADLSLQTEAEKSPPNNQKDGGMDLGAGISTVNESGEEDQEMLDAQLKGNITESSILEGAGATEAADAREEAQAEPKKGEPTIEDLCSKAPVSKKRKRKSLPPVKKIDATQPAIITFDSLGAPHPPTIRTLKHYLREEAIAKRNGLEFDESQLKGMTAKQIPQQDNFSDCGLFLLGYMDKFLESPKEFVEKVIKREYDVKKDWPRMDPSEMRTKLRALIQKLHLEQENERLQEKRERGKLAGKVVDKQRKEPEPNPSSDPLQADETNRQLAAVPSVPNRLHEANADLRTVKTRADALQSALTIDSQESAKATDQPTEDKATEPAQTHLKPTLPTPTLPKDTSLVIIDSQPAVPNHSFEPQNPDVSLSSPTLASEIADSQPLIPAAEIPSSPPILPERPREEIEQSESHEELPSSALPKSLREEIEHIAGHDGLPARDPAAGQENEEVGIRPRRPKEKGREREKERKRQTSVVEIDD